ALYLPNTLWHPIGFFGALRAGAHVVHLSPLDAERELVHKLTDSGARTVVTVNLFGLEEKALKLAAAGHVDHVIVADDSVWVPSAPSPIFASAIASGQSTVARGCPSPPPGGGRSARFGGPGGGDSRAASEGSVSRAEPPHPGLPSAVRPSPSRGGWPVSTE